MSAAAKAMKALLKRAAKNPGVTVGQRPSGHLCVYRDGNLVATMSLTPRSDNAVKAAAGDLRRAGIRV